MLAENPVPQAQYAEWRQDVREKAVEFPMWYPERDDVIIPQWAIKVSQALKSPKAQMDQPGMLIASEFISWNP